MSWKTRKRGTVKQLGKRFPVKNNDIQYEEKNVVLFTRQRKPMRFPEYIGYSDVPSPDTTDQFYGKGWSWRGDDETLKKQLREVGYQKEELGWFCDFLVHRPPKNEIFAIKSSEDRGVGPYFKFTWRERQNNELENEKNRNCKATRKKVSC